MGVVRGALVRAGKLSSASSASSAVYPGSVLGNQPQRTLRTPRNTRSWATNTLIPTTRKMRWLTIELPTI